MIVIPLNVLVKEISVMKNVKLILIVLFLVMLPLLLVANQGGSPAASAAPVAVTACYYQYLPAIVSGDGAAEMGTLGNSGELAIAEPMVGTQEGGALRAADEVCGPVSNNFPDFNGDGYADLAIGVPHKDIVVEEESLENAGIVQVIYGSADGLNAVAGQAAVDDQLLSRELGGADVEDGDFYGAALAIGDFNNDGYDDLAVGISGAWIDGLDTAGAVQVIYGSASGLDEASIEEWSRNSTGIEGAATAFDYFGQEVTAGDYNNDGYSDLAIGVPHANVNGDDNAGAVHILYGRDLGLSYLGNDLLTQDTNGFIASPAEAEDYFGQTLTSGDFNGDGVDDLATGTPREDNGDDFADAGSVQIFFGQSGAVGDWGIVRFGSVANPQHWTADSNDYVEGAMEAGDQLGYSLTAGDFNGDGYDDLAAGLPLETHGSGAGALELAGAVNVFQGGATGLVATAASPARLWHQDIPDMVDGVASGERFGISLAAADFDNDGYEDLAIGVLNNIVFGLNLGSVHLVYGSGAGLTTAGNELVYDPLNPNAADGFSGSVTAGDYNGDGFAELAVGASRDEPPGTADDSGSVLTFASDSSGVLQTEAQKWYPGHNGLQGTPATDDFFGSYLPGS
jgi:hypothetical protein